MNSPFVAFPALTVGPTGEVWASDTGTSGDLYRYDPFFGGFRHVVYCAAQIQAGGNGVGARSGSNIYRLEPNTMSFVHVPGSLASISVGSGGGVWGISSGQVYKFTTP